MVIFVLERRKVLVKIVANVPLNMLTENIMHFRILNLYEPPPPTNG
jgi:hypothetical protein